MGVLDAWTVACPAKLHPIQLIEIRGHADLSTLANWVAGRQVRIKAGRLVGLADSYAVIVLADNATFLLAVNRIAALR